VAAPRTEGLEDRNVTAVTPLRTPRKVKTELPVPPETAAAVKAAREAIRAVLHGQDPRLVVVVGPCSIHDPKAAVDYAERLRAATQPLEDALLVVMRTYFEKPRTTVGWKGLVNDPHLDGSCDVQEGLRLARQVLLDVSKVGMPCGSEMLDPITPQYIADLLAWASIGARTTESQTHREMASGLSMPVGFKNGTDGGVQVAVDAMTSAGHPHTFLGIDVDGVTSTIRTCGNPDRHIVLRGGRTGSNHRREDVEQAAALVAGQGIARPIMVDCSHGNSAKNPTNQVTVAQEVLTQLPAGTGPRPLMGLLLESHLVGGRQDWKPNEPLRYGQSITDACLGWDETAALLGEIAKAARAARRAA
jgi:3-deoxy-7-phosphoheptulonate synthase